jgi:fermentation-respiration switch protein FrsA (DUF1100 family)
MKRKLYGILITVIVICSVCTIGGSFYMLNYSLTPNKNIEIKNRETYPYLFRTYPFLRQWTDSLKQHRALREITIRNTEGLLLHAYYIKAAKPTGKTAVIVHGYTDCAIRMLMIAYLYNHDLQFNALLPDLQHQGKSEGKAVTMGWKDRLDVLHWARVANHLFGDSTHIVFHGISMGAATVMMASGEPQPRFVKCYVEDCGYTSVWDEFSYELNTAFGLPKFPLLYATSYLCKLKYGWNFKEASALKQVKKCRLPMLFIHGDKDTYVPSKMVISLYEAKPNPKEYWIVCGATHAMSYHNEQKAYTEKIRHFTNKYLN